MLGGQERVGDPAACAAKAQFRESELDCSEFLPARFSFDRQVSSQETPYWRRIRAFSTGLVDRVLQSLWVD